MVGQTISHYRVLEKIGEGGMGEVYRAEDTNLDREVAIKVLPEQFTQDPQRLARFEREAKLLASLNHPNIAAIYGFEHSDETHFLVLELVEGETLAERVAKGALPVEEALEVCRQIAEGVEAAHEKGVIHRDLKPATVKVTPEGKVKILDFGLAKAFEEKIPAADIAQSPTLTEEMTKAGVILGTAGYMSPEQAQGKPVDKRADVFAFGAVLYELLTGERAFQGETITETIAAVLKSEPEWEALPLTTPWRIQDLLRRCLTKDPHDRLRDIANVRVEVKLALKEPATVSPIGGTSPMVSARQLWVIAVGLIIATAIASGIGVWSLMPSSPSEPRPLRKFVIRTAQAGGLESNRSNDVAISSDGKHIVYRAQNQLYLRPLDGLIATPIPGTTGVDRNFFISPDGEWVGFVVTDKLIKGSLVGGAAMTICDAPTMEGGSWGSDDTIVFATNEGLYRVSANGGQPETLASPDLDKDELEYQEPKIRPGGKAVLFAIYSVDGSYRTAILSLETGEKRILVEGARAPQYAPTGHLTYELTGTGTLMAVPFDPSELAVTGDAVPILEGVRTAGVMTQGTADYSFSGDGTLVYIDGESSIERSLVWVDHSGVESQITDEKRAYENPVISPNGKQVALNIQNNVWIYDLEGNSFSRLTLEGNLNRQPTWAPDGKWIVFRSNRDDPGNLYRKPADGSGSTERLTTSPFTQAPYSWSPDGSAIALIEIHPETGFDVLTLSMDSDTEPQVLIRTSVRDCCPQFSPDGHWLAYVSAETGREHVYVLSYPGAEDKWLVSGEQGGGEPVWSPDGRELYYRIGDQMIAVDIEIEPTFKAGKPRVLFTASYAHHPLNRASQFYDISPDGQRFLMIKDEGTPANQINVVLNWFEELKRLVPTP